MRVRVQDANHLKHVLFGDTAIVQLQIHDHVANLGPDCVPVIGKLLPSVMVIHEVLEQIEPIRITDLDEQKFERQYDLIDRLRFVEILDDVAFALEILANLSVFATGILAILGAERKMADFASVASVDLRKIIIVIYLLFMV